jgi:flagellum-specific ATP synthase
MTIAWELKANAAQSYEFAQVSTKVIKIVGLLIEASPLKIPLGSKLSITTQAGQVVSVECVGFTDQRLLLMPYGEIDGISPGDRVVFESDSQQIWVGDKLLGRVLNGEGECIDGDSPELEQQVPLYGSAPSPLDRKNEKNRFSTGIRAWDTFLTMGKGQRMGIFAGTGVGKSVLLGMIARESSADVNVLALVGERGHEVKEFIEGVLGEEGMKKTVLVVATSDQSPLMRMRAAFVAKAIAEYFANQGKDVLYMMDSVTRMAMAMRELGLSVGEPPTAKGYPPSVFATLPRLLERAGTFHNGTITSIITVLLEGDDLNDPIGDAVRGILDGHVVLSRDLANRGHFPAIEVTESISRWMTDIVDQDWVSTAIMGRKALSDYRQAEDLINVGAYVSGSNPDIDSAIQCRPTLNAFLKQGIQEVAQDEQILGDLKRIFQVED